MLEPRDSSTIATAFTLTVVNIGHPSLNANAEEKLVRINLEDFFILCSNSLLKLNSYLLNLIKLLLTNCFVSVVSTQELAVFSSSISATQTSRSSFMRAFSCFSLKFFSISSFVRRLKKPYWKWENNCKLQLRHFWQFEFKK